MYHNLRAERIARGLSQAQMAENLDIPTNTYNNYELGVREPKSDFWIAVAELWRVSIDYLMGFCDDPQSTKYAVTFNTTKEERALVTAWREADERTKRIVETALHDYGFPYELPKEKEA